MMLLAEWRRARVTDNTHQFCLGVRHDTVVALPAWKHQLLSTTKIQLKQLKHICKCQFKSHIFH